MATLLGIDLGTHSVKLAVMEGRLGRMTLSGFRCKSVPSENGEAPTLAARAEVLRDLLDQEGEAAVHVAGYPTEQVSIRSVVMPFSDASQVSKTLAFELEGHVPFDLDDFLLDYRIVGEGRGARLTADGKSLVLCGLAQEEQARDWVDALEAVGADPRQIVLDAEMLSHLADASSAQLVIDVGHTRTLLAFCVAGEVLSVRAINFGGLDLTKALMQSFKWDYAEAQAQKHGASVNPLELALQGEGEEDSGAAEPSTPTEIARVLTHALQPLVAEIRTTLFSFEGQHAVEIDEVLLTGGSSHLAGLSAVMGKGLGVAARTASIADEARSVGDGGRFALAQGLVLRGAGLKGANAFNFRKGALAHAGNLALGRNLLRYGAVAMLFFGLAGTVVYMQKRGDIQDQIESVQSEIVEVVAQQFPDFPRSTFEGKDRAHKHLFNVSMDVRDRLDILEGTVSGQPPTLSLLRDLSEAMPEASEARIAVTNMTISEKSVFLKAKTTNFDTAATIEKALQSHERFKNAKKGDENKSGELSFSITIPLEEKEKDGEEG